MDSKIIFVRTAKGEEEIRGRSASLSGDIKRALLMVDGSSTFGEIEKHAAPSLRGVLNESFRDLVRSGYIEDKARAAQSANIPKMAQPSAIKAPRPTGMPSGMKTPAKEDLGELDFTGVFRAPSPEALAAEGARLEAERKKKEAEAEAKRKLAEQEAAKAQAELAKTEAEARAHAEAAAKVRKEIEAAKLKAQQAADAARIKAEQEAAKAREEAERARKLMAQAQAKAEAEARAHAEAAASARKEIEAAKQQAQQEAEAARLKAEQETERARKEAEQARRLAAEAASAREEVERQAREEAELARQKAEREADLIRAELAQAKAKAEAEAHAYAEAAAGARKEIEAVKLKAQQEAEEARQKAEQVAAAAREEAEQAKREAAEAARLKAEQAEAQARAELAEAQAKAEVEQARQQAAEAQAKAEAEAIAHAEAEVRARKEVEAAKSKAQQEAEAARLKAEQDAARAREEAITAREEAEQAKRLVAQAQAQAQADALAHAEAEASAREEAEAVKLRAQQETEAARLKAEQDAASAREEAEQAKRQAEEAAAAREEIEHRAREQADAARLKAEQEAEQARAELAQAQAKAEAELVRRQAAEAQAKAEAEALAQAEITARKETEAAKLMAQQEAEAARQHAEREAAKAQEEAARAREEAIRAREEAEQAMRLVEDAQARAEFEAVARAEAEAGARKEAEAAKLKAQQYAESVRQKAEQVASRAREEAIAAREEAEQARQLVAQAQAQAEAEALAYAEADVRTHKEIEAVKLKSQQDAEIARQQAEREAARAQDDAARAREEAVRAREEAEQARQLVAQAQARAEVEALAHAEAEAGVRKEVEAAKLKAQQEAEAERLKAEQEAARAQEEAEQARLLAAEAVHARMEVERRAAEQAEQAELARQQAEQDAARAKAEIEAAMQQLRQEAEAARVKAEQDAVRMKAEAEAAMQKVMKEAEAARLKAEREAALAREEAEELKRQAAEAKEKANNKAESAGQKVQREAEAERIEEESLKAEHEAQRLARMAAALKSAGAEYQRSTSATVLFFDMVGYTKQPVNKQIKLKKRFNQLVSDCLGALGDGDERIILDTGDGAAIGFLQHPEDALYVARQFRKAVTAHHHQDYPELTVRTGIHLGPVSIVKDMNGQSNMVGDGINDAQRVMSFAGIDQIYISRSYYDFISRLSDEYADLFQYRGQQQDKHGREHAVYELVDLSVTEAAPRAAEKAPPITLEPFVFAPDESAPAAQEEPALQEAQAEPVPSVEVPITLDLDQAKTADETPPPRGERVAPVQPSGGDESKAVPEEKPKAEAHMPTEEEVAAMAAAQAKAWSKAEERAVREKEERATQPLPQPEAPPPAVRARRKPVPWGGVGAGLFALLIVALFAAPFLLPMRDYADGIERTLAERFGQPVHIGRMSGRILPTPRLELEAVAIGEAGEVRVQSAQLDFAFSALFSSRRTIDSLSLDGVRVEGGMLQRLSDWLVQMAVDAQYPVGHVELGQGALDAGGLQLSGIDGELNFDAAGRFTRANLHAADKLTLDIAAGTGDRLKASIKVRGALPLLPAWTFDELTAAGELTRDRLSITEIDGSIMDGRLLGKLDLSWAEGWKAQGDLVARVVTVQKFGTALGGDLDGSASFRMRADSLAKLPESAVVEGTFVVGKGVVNGFDIVEAVRLRSRESRPGGRTHFDELSGDLNYENGDYRFRRLRMKAGVLSASGSLDVVQQNLSGQIAAELSMRSGSGSAALQVGGTTAVPTIRLR